MTPVLQILANLQQSLLKQYTEVEKTPRSIPYSCAEGLHEIFMSAFFDIAELHALRDITLHPLAPPEADARLRRAEEEQAGVQVGGG